MKKGGIAILSSLLVAVATVIGLTGSASAAGNAATWTDTSGDHKFSTAANWASGVVPTNGDELIFDTSTLPAVSSYDVNNDLAVSFSGVKIQGSPIANYMSMTFANDIVIANNGVWDVPNTTQVNLLLATGKTVTAQGDLTIISGFPSSLTATGALTMKAGTFLLGAIIPSINASQINLENGSIMTCFNGDTTINTPLVLGGGTSTTLPEISYGACSGGGTGADVPYVLTLADVTLAGDAYVGVYTNDTVRVAKLTDNGHSLTRTPAMNGGVAADGTLELPGNTQTTNYPVVTTQLDGDKPTEDITVHNNETAILNGSRCNVSVTAGGLLKGSGQVCSLSVFGTVAPGNSPGSITVQQRLTLGDGSHFTAEVASATSYDQIITTDVLIGSNAVLDLTFLPGASVQAGDTYRIIDSTSTAPVSGEFRGLPEGTKFNIAGGTLQITYKGGDGNDVVVTVLSVPNVPNTGFQRLNASPFMIGLGTVLVFATLVVLARRKTHA